MSACCVKYVAGHLLLVKCAEHINENYIVDSVCRSWPKRMQELKDAKGELLPQ